MLRTKLVRRLFDSALLTVLFAATSTSLGCSMVAFERPVPQTESELIRPGATQVDVAGLLGAPDVITPRSKDGIKLNGEVWSYTKLHRSAAGFEAGSSVEIAFDSTGAVAEVSQELPAGFGNSEASRGNEIAQDLKGQAVRIETYEQCVAAGYPALRSQPGQCVGPDGRRFVESAAQKEASSVIELPALGAEIREGATNSRDSIGKSGCVDQCGDGKCAEMVCMALGCPCAESPSSCPADCK